MTTLRKRRPRRQEIIYWPRPYREDGKNLFFKIRLNGRNFRFCARRHTGAITISPNDFAKLCGFKKMRELEAYLKQEGGRVL